MAERGWQPPDPMQDLRDYIDRMGEAERNARSQLTQEMAKAGEEAMRAKRLADQAKAAMEADRIVREKATLDAIASIRTLAEAAAAASAERERVADQREARMIHLTDRLLSLTKVLVALGALTLCCRGCCAHRRLRSPLMPSQFVVLDESSPRSIQSSAWAASS